MGAMYPNVSILSVIYYKLVLPFGVLGNCNLVVRKRLATTETFVSLPKINY